MKSVIIGLTGPSGAGKSTVAETAKKLGFYTVNCDAAARRALSDKNLLKALQEAFSEDIIKDGKLDRRALAKRAFANEAATETLNRLTLPVIVSLIEGEIVGKPLVLLDAPTLYESGLDSRCDAVIGVLAERKICRERIVLRDALTDEDADARMRAAKDESFFRSRCDVLIFNDGTKEELETKAASVLSKYI